MSNDKINQLTIYLSKMAALAKMTSHPEKKAFFEREVKRTRISIERLSK